MNWAHIAMAKRHFHRKSVCIKYHADNIQLQANSTVSAKWKLKPYKFSEAIFDK
jgi:hypothetical protein